MGGDAGAAYHVVPSQQPAPKRACRILGLILAPACKPAMRRRRLALPDRVLPPTRPF